MSKPFGFELSQRQILSRVGSEVDLLAKSFELSDRYGDSPIEKLFYFSLYASLRFCPQEFFTGLIPVSDETIESLKLQPHAKRHLLIERQAQLTGWRVDFLVTVYADWAREPDGGVSGWKQLIVECDGHDFHERTKEQAAKDRDRDRRFQLAGIEVFRFTGSELWKDPVGCAEQVIAWANRRV